MALAVRNGNVHVEAKSRSCRLELDLEKKVDGRVCGHPIPSSVQLSGKQTQLRNRRPDTIHVPPRDPPADGLVGSRRNKKIISCPQYAHEWRKGRRPEVEQGRDGKNNIRFSFEWGWFKYM